MGFFDIVKKIGGAIVRGAKIVLTMIGNSSPVVKAVAIAATLAVPVVSVVSKLVKSVKRVKSNKAPENIMEQSLAKEADDENSEVNQQYRGTVKNIAGNMCNRKSRPIRKKKDLFRELKRTCEEIDRDCDEWKYNDKDLREARAEMARISKRVKNRARFA